MKNTFCVLAAVLMSAPLLRAQNGVPDVTTINFTHVRQATTPYIQTVNISGTTGTISVGSCVDVIGTLCNQGVLHTALDPSSSVPTKIRVWLGGPVAVGTYQATFAITGTAAPFTLTVNMDVVTWTSAVFNTIGPPSGACVGCTNSSANYQDTDTAPFSPARRPGGTYLPPTTACAQFYDDNTFGSYKTVLAAPDPTKAFTGLSTQEAIWIQAEDSVTTAWNADGSYVRVSNISGFSFFVNTKNCVIDYPSVGQFAVGNTEGAMDPVDPKAFYGNGTGGLTIYKNALLTPPNVSINTTVEYTYTATVDATNITNGGDGSINHDGWWCLYTYGGGDLERVLIMHNVLTHQTVTTSYDNTAIVFNGNTRPRQCTVAPGVNIPDGKTYIELGGFSANALFSLKNNAITYEGAFPQNPEAPNAAQHDYTGPTCDNTAATHGNCYKAAHHTWVMVNGVAFFVYYFDSDSLPRTMVAARADCGVNKFAQFVENGGCAVAAFPSEPSTQDEHVSCAIDPTRPVCVYATEDVSAGGVYAWLVSGVTVGATTNISYTCSGCAVAPSNGQVILINQVLGVTGLSGINTCTVANQTGTATAGAFDCTGLPTTSGTYTSGSGSFIINTTPTSISHQGEAFLLDFSNLTSTDPVLKKTVKVTRFGHLRSVGMGQDRANSFGGGTYYSNHKVNMSQDGTKFTWLSNYGVPDYQGVYMMDTGWRPGSNIATGKIVKSGKVVSQ